MKNVIIILSLLLGALTVSAQAPLTMQKKAALSGQKVVLTKNSKISKKFTEPDVYQINTRQILTTLKSPDFDSQLKLQFGTQQNWDLELYQVELLSPDYKLRVLTDRGIEEHGAPEIKTYYGNLKGRPDTEVRLTIKDDFLYGFVEDGENTVYFEPAGRFQPTLNKGEVVVYRPDQVTGKTGSCAYNEKAHKVHNNSSNPPAQTRTANGDCFELELSIATDYSYYLARGSDVNEVTAYTLGVMNDVATNYQLSGSTNFADGIEFLIVENFVVTTSNGDPWTDSTNSSDLLNSFTGWANDNGFSATHDLGQLWTNRNFDGSTVGVAWVGALCSNYRYHILEDIDGSANQRRVLVAHEIGHNFGAGHDAAGSNFIMAPSVSSATNWSQASKNSANQSITNASTGGGACLAGCTDTPPNSNFTASIDCAGMTVNFFDNSTNDPNSWNWSFPGGIPSSSTLQNPTVVYNNLGNYDVTLTAANDLGTGTTENKSNFIDINSESPDGACVPGGSLGNGGIRFFSLESISNSSGTAVTDGSTYLDNSCLQVANLTPDETYGGFISVGDPNSNTLTESVRIYIDYNNNGDFMDTGELIISSGNNQFSAGNLTFDYSVPETPPVSGVILRMRVIVNQGISSPCQDMTTGQVEDYGVIFSGMAPLPVTLTSYEAAPENKYSLLNWTTESEFNNDYYTLEHSTDGRSFEFLDEVSGQGTTNEISKYEYLHKKPIIGDNYYRLTQNDFDGTQEVLGTRVVNFKTDEVIVDIQPNPIVDQMVRTAYISPEDGSLELTVVGVDGKIIKQINQEILSGTTMINLDLPELSNGVYFLRTVLGDTIKINRFIKTN